MTLDVGADDSTEVDAPDLEHRCERCHHPLRAAASVLAGLGPVCRRLAAQEAA